MQTACFSTKPCAHRSPRPVHHTAARAHTSNPGRRCSSRSILRAAAAAADQEQAASGSVSAPAAPAAVLEGETAAAAAAAPSNNSDSDNSSSSATSDAKKQADVGQRTRQRLVRRASSWRQELQGGAPSTGLVRISSMSKSAAAAVCVASDLQRQPPTRLVATTLPDAGKAFSILRLAAAMLNNTYTWRGEAGLLQQQQLQQLQQQQQQPSATAAAVSSSDAAAAAAPAVAAVAAVGEGSAAPLVAASAGTVLVFQPVQVKGVLVVPSEMPEGSVAFYTYTLPADNPVLREVASQRAQQQQQQQQEDIAAAAAVNSSSSGRQPATRRRVVGIGHNCAVGKAAYAVTKAVAASGWAQVQAVDDPTVLQTVTQVLLRVRGQLHREAALDAAVLLLDSPREQAAPAGAAPSAEQQQDSLQQEQEAVDGSSSGNRQGTLWKGRSQSFLVIACGKNKPTSLKLPGGGGSSANSRARRRRSSQQ